MRLRILNGERDLHFVPEHLNSLWGRLATYQVTPVIQVEGYAVPNLDFYVPEVII